MTKREWARFGIAAYGPTLVAMMGAGAIIPLIPLTARELGSTVPEAALIAGLLGIGSLVGALPAGVFTERVGERRALVLACVLDAVGTLVMMYSPNLFIFGAAVFWCGTQQAIVALARQSYLTHAFPATKRARALSTLGGVFRMGYFLGPLAGAALIHNFAGLQAAYWFAFFMNLVAAGIAATLPDLPETVPPSGPVEAPPTLAFIMRTYLFLFLTQGLGASALNLVRAARDALLPLWCESQGLNATTVSLVFALASGVDMLLFYFGGQMMDKHGRRFVAIPAMVIMGTCFAVLPLAHTALLISVVALVLGLGNGISSGVVMTLGSDAAPKVGTPQFLGGWRLTAGIGAAVGPLVVTGVAAVASLAAASWVIAAIGFGGAAWMHKWIPHTPLASGDAGTQDKL